MKAIVICLLPLACLSFAQGQKLFHDHVSEFTAVIREEAAAEIVGIFVQYAEFDEFRGGLHYLHGSTFKHVIDEMEALPEFIAVLDFLEKDNIDIRYFIDKINEMIEAFQSMEFDARSRQSVSGRDLNSFITDVTAAFPKEKLAALYDQKMSDDEDFRAAILNLQGDEWKRVFGALWDSTTFQEEVKSLAENGLDIHLVLDEIKAVFGQ